MKFHDMIKDELALVEKEIEYMMPKEPPEVYGMLYPFIKRGGKRIRPMLVLLACSATGGDRSKAIRIAALIEMFHSFTLIHDDICDNSLMRRGLPTLHVQYGTPIAINAGDALYTLLWKGLGSSGIPPEKNTVIMNICADAFLGVVEGQGIELEWYRKKKFDVSREEYRIMAGGKTAALIGLSCEIGAIMADAPENERTALKFFGRHIGLAFQIRDDILNLVGNVEEYKKEIGGDITEGKRTLMVVHALERATKKDRSELIGILGEKTKKSADIKNAIEILRRYGSIDYAASVADDLVRAAKKELDILPDSAEKEALLELTDFVTTRKS